MVASAIGALSLNMYWGEEPPYVKDAVTFLNNKTTTSGMIERDSILYYLDKPLFSRDTAGKVHQVLSFTFTYVNVDIYIDQNGKPFIGSEKYGSPSDKGIVSAEWMTMMKENLKSGDSVIFSNPLSFYELKDPKSRYYSPRIVLEVK